MCLILKKKIPMSPHFLLFDTSKPVIFFQMCLIRTTTAYPCPNIKFDAVDASECRSEEVMYLLTLSVLITHLLYIFLTEGQDQYVHVLPGCVFVCVHNYVCKYVNLCVCVCVCVWGGGGRTEEVTKNNTCTRHKNDDLTCKVRI